MAGGERAEDVLDLLVAEHREVEDLLIGLRHAGTAQARREVANQLIAILVRHSVVEETFVSPVVRDYLIHGEETVARDLDEHRELELLLKDLEAVDAGDPRFMGVVVDLQTALARHFTDEECRLFPQLRLAAPLHELRALRSRVQDMQRVGPARYPGEAGDDGSSALLVGPGVGMVDRLREALEGLRGRAS